MQSRKLRGVVFGAESDRLAGEFVQGDALAVGGELRDLLSMLVRVQGRSLHEFVDEKRRAESIDQLGHTRPPSVLRSNE